MLIFLQHGRFGNQISQILFLLNKRKKNKVILLIGFKQFKTVFQPLQNVLFIKNNNFFKIIKKINNYQVVKKFIKKPFKQFYTEKSNFNNTNYRYYTTNIKIKSGNTFITLAQRRDYSSDFFFNQKDLSKLLFKEDKYIQAKRFFENISNFQKKIFVHCRRGDFNNINHPYLGSFLLPNTYYYKSIEYFKNTYDSLIFIFLTDDYQWVKDNFNFINSKVIPNNNPFWMDFIIMTICDGGIISNSTFSWWAGYLNVFKNQNNIILGPKYFRGFNKNCWFPDGIYTNKFKWLEVY